jgi:outer membrane protein TolC
LECSEVIRVLTGVSSSSSGQTIYDTAIAATNIDQAKAPFDPVFTANSSFRRIERPFLTGPGTSIAGIATQGNDSSLGLQDLNRFGGVAEIRAFNAWDSENSVDFLSRNQPALELSYTQPLLAGAGRAANEAPIVIARLQQEQSYFAFKGSVQELVRGVIDAYWSLVQARTELWAREQQVEQAKFAYELVEAKFRSDLADRGDVTQPKVAYANFRATLIAAQANVLQREAALRNLIGLPPEDGSRIVPSTPPTRDRVEFRWDEIVETAQRRRPDLIELNLILMADQQRLIQNRNFARPNLDAVAVNGWNGLSGRAFSGRQVNTPFDNHNDWTLGVNFSVPLSLRQSRAQVRSTELLIARDRANINQALHQIEHQLATTIRTVDQNLLQYEAYRETRAAATENLRVQFAERQVGLSIFLDVLLAITDWGNAVASEAQALTSYNTELANLEEQTGTILDTHGIRFVEEQFASVGVHGYCFEEECYPRDLRPTDNAVRYLDGGEPAEESFDLDDAPRRNPLKPLLHLPETPVDSPAEPMPEGAATPDYDPAPARQP